MLIDIDHSPRHVLHASHAHFYTPRGSRPLRDRLTPRGVFGLWSDDPPDQAYLEVLAAGFAEVRAEVVAFSNPFIGGESTNTIYLASGVDGRG